ncbi:MAG: GGDEF domain-containing protein [Pseudomonadota bacterium]
MASPKGDQDRSTHPNVGPAVGPSVGPTLGPANTGNGGATGTVGVASTSHSELEPADLEALDGVALRARVRALEAEISAFKNQNVRNRQRLHRFDPETGLPARAQLIERAAAEFLRSKRYDHHISVLLVGVRGLEAIETKHGQETATAIFQGVVQVCETVSRTGIDLLGVFDRNVLAIVLPETRLSGALALGDRLKDVSNRKPFQVNQHQVRPALKVVADAVLRDDKNIQSVLTRAAGAMGASQL